MKAKIFISDVHIKKSQDEPSLLFHRFLLEGASPQVEEIYLVGDIFDAMVGGYVEYLMKFEKIFYQLKVLLEMDKKIFFLEGNHDFHLRQLFETFERRESLKNKITYIKYGMVTSTADGKTIFVTHGDEIELNNLGYIIYKRLVNNRFFDIATNSFLSFRFIEKLTQWASGESRNKNKHRYESPDMQIRIKEKFRASADYFLKDCKFDYLVCGHSHMKDEYRTQTGALYLNNGYAPVTKSYLRIDCNGAEFRELSSN